MIDHFNSATENDGLGDALFGEGANADDFTEAVSGLTEADAPKLVAAWNEGFDDASLVIEDK